MSNLLVTTLYFVVLKKLRGHFKCPTREFSRPTIRQSLQRNQTGNEKIRSDDTKNRLFGWQSSYIFLKCLGNHNFLKMDILFHSGFQ